MNPAHRLHHRLRATQLASVIALQFLPIAWAGAQSASVNSTPADAPDGVRATQSDPVPGPRLPQVEITGTAAPMLDARPSSTSRLPMSVRETPASVIVIDRATIDAMSATNTQDILRAVPGVSFSSQPGSPGSVFYRGFGASSLAQLYNGISVQYDAIAARPVDAWLVERVEAIGGPSSFLHGSGAVGGAINVITKIADLSGDLSQVRGKLGTERQLAASLQRQTAERAADGHVLRVDLNATDGTHWAMGADRESWQAAGSWRAALGATLSHTLSVEKQHEKVRQPYWGTPVLRDAAGATLGEVALDRGTRGVNYNAIDGRYQQDVTWVRAILAWQPMDTLRATHTLYAYDALRDYENIEAYAFVAGNSRIQRSNALLQRHDQQVWGSRAEVALATVLGGLKSDFAVGWDWSYNRQTRFPLSVAGPFDTTDPYSPAPRRFYDTPGIVPVYTPGATNQLRTFALFAENRTVLAPTWAVTTGLRADRIGLTVTNHRTVTATNPAVYETSFSPVTGRIGLVKDLAPQWQAYVQWSTAADPPAGILSTAGFSALRNFDLTRGQQIEIGSKSGFDGGRGEVTAALYRIERKNLAMTDPADRTRVIPIGAQSSRGVEVTARWRPLSSLQLSGHASYVDAQFEEFVETVGTSTVSRAGNRPANVPDVVAGLATTWRPWAALALDADWRHVGKRFGNNANTVYEGSYALFGLGVRHELTPSVTLRARIDNLTDETYSATVGSGLVVLGAPRTWQASVDWRF